MTNRFAGQVETVEPTLVGWVVDRQRTGSPVRFTVTVDRTWRFAVVADRPRPDVAAGGFGGPNCGFALALPPRLFDGAPHDIDLTLADGEMLELPAWRSPVVLGPLSADIVPITALDLDAAADLLRLTYTEGGIELDAVTDRYVAAWIEAAIGPPGGLLFGARVECRLVGYAMLERGGAEGPAIGAVALSVLRHYRRKGLGERLMRALLAGVRNAGIIGEVWLSVEPGNLPARRLYEKLGFVDRTEPPASLIVPANFLVMLWRPDRLDR